MAQTETAATDGTPEDGVITGASPKAFKARIEKSKTKKRDLIPLWQESIDYRRGKPTDVDSDDARNPISLDWSNTEVAIAQLFSQVPTVVVKGKGKFAQAAPPVQERLNYRLKKAKVGVAFDQVMPDVVNAAGAGAVLVSYEALMGTRSVPVIADNMLPWHDKALIKLGVMQREMMDQPFAYDKKFAVDHISMADLLWPEEFKGSDFDDASWIGHSARAPYEEACSMFPTLVDEDKEKICGDNRTSQDRLSSSEDPDAYSEEDVVSYDEIFYWRYRYHKGEKSYSAIHRLVFVDGVDEPVVDEPWKGQRLDPEIGTYIGACKFPIRVLTLAHMSDEAIPPSQSAIIRHGVKALIRSRLQQDQQREFSKPMRWGDTNRIDADILTAIMNGEWQHIIPTQGSGEKAIGEVARSNYPREGQEFDAVLKSEVQDAVGAGPNQMGNMNPGERSAAEARIAQGNFSTRTGQKRARTVAFFLGIAEVMLGLMCLYDDFALPEQPPDQRLQMWDKTRINHELIFDLRGDATVLLTADEQIDRLMRFINMAGPSQFVNPEPIIRELAALSGLDPDEVVVKPQPKKPDAPSISLRFTGTEDLRDPMVTALLMKADMAPGIAELKAAIALIQSAGTVTTLELGSKEDKATTTVHEAGVEPVTDPGPTAVGDPVQGMENVRPEMTTPGRINTRRDSGQE